jgi:hypothetical protein
MASDGCTVQTFRGSITFRPCEGPARCSLGCGRRGGGMLLAYVVTDGDEQPVLPMCGDCLARAIVDRIGANTGSVPAVPTESDEG